MGWYAWTGINLFLSIAISIAWGWYSDEPNRQLKYLIGKGYMVEFCPYTGTVRLYPANGYYQDFATINDAYKHVRNGSR